MKKLFLILLLITVSCTTTKDVIKAQKATNKSSIEYSTSIIKRPKDSVVFVPNYQFKDTTIVVRGKTTRLSLIYDTAGKVIQADCTADELNEIKNTIKQLTENIQEQTRTKTKDTEVSSSLILYVFLGLIVLMVINKLMNKII